MFKLASWILLVALLQWLCYYNGNGLSGHLSLLSFVYPLSINFLFLLIMSSTHQHCLTDVSPREVFDSSSKF